MFHFISELLLVVMAEAKMEQIGNDCSISGFKEVGSITDDATGKFINVADPGSPASGEQQCGDYESTLKSEGDITNKDLRLIISAFTKPNNGKHIPYFTESINYLFLCPSIKSSICHHQISPCIYTLIKELNMSDA